MFLQSVKVTVPGTSVQISCANTNTVWCNTARYNSFNKVRPSLSWPVSSRLFLRYLGSQLIHSICEFLVGGPPANLPSTLIGVVQSWDHGQHFVHRDSGLKLLRHTALKTPSSKQACFMFFSRLCLLFSKDLKSIINICYISNTENLKIFKG